MINQLSARPRISELTVLQILGLGMCIYDATLKKGSQTQVCCGCVSFMILFVSKLIWRGSGCRVGLEDMWVPWLKSCAFNSKTPRRPCAAPSPCPHAWQHLLDAAQCASWAAERGQAVGLSPGLHCSLAHYPPSLHHFLPSTFLLPRFFSVLYSTQLNL